MSLIIGSATSWFPRSSIFSLKSLGLPLLLVAMGASSGAWAAAPEGAPITLVQTVQDGNGKPFSLSDYRGKVVYVDFWASWCAPCRKSFPWMNEMHARYGDKGLAIIAINLDTAPADAKPFLKDLKPRFDIGYDSEGKVAKAFDLLGMPSSFVFDKQGNLVKRHVGFFTEQAREYEAELVKLMEQQ